MADRLKLSLGGVWWIASLSALILPIFLPSYATSPGFQGNAMATSTAAMFILSLPSSLFAVPLIFMIDAVLGLSGSSIPLAYANLFILFIVGLFQWFLMFPSLLASRTYVQKLDLSGAAGNTRLFARDLTVWVDPQGTTPLERVLEEE